MEKAKKKVVSIRLNKIVVKNFKALERMEVKANGKDVTVLGKNGTGKTTVADAYAWLMTGKGIDGTKIDTQIKKRDENGGTPNDGGVEHKVEAEISIDGEPMTLGKTYKEKWEKHRGQAESEFKGHTVTYEVNGVPMAKKDFDVKLETIAAPDVFQMLTRPLYFCTGLKWQERRSFLMSIIGGKSDIDIVNADKGLRLGTESLGFTDKLGKVTVDELRKVIQSKLKKVNAEIKEIPARIDELTRQKGGLDEDARAKLEEEWQDLQNQRSVAEGRVAQLKHGGDASLSLELGNVEAQMHKWKAKSEAEITRKRTAAQEVINGCNYEATRLDSECKRLEEDNDRLKAIGKTNDDMLTKMRAEWKAINAETFDADISDTCPACGQKLPEGKLQEAIENARGAFNEKKAARLKENQQKGKSIAETQKRDAATIEKNESRIAEITERMKELEASKHQAEAELKVLDNVDVTKEGSYVALARTAEDIKARIESSQTDSSKPLAEEKEKLAGIMARMEETEAQLAQIKTFDSINERIEELKEQETELGNTYTKLQAELGWTEHFMRVKVKSIEADVNKHFKFVKFKMFNQLINGALEDCCEPLIDGVPFSDGLNKGSRMKAALDIANTLSEHYGVKLPVIIDDCESYTNLPDVDTQVIKLIADKRYDKLAVEIEG